MTSTSRPCRSDAGYGRSPRQFLGLLTSLRRRRSQRYWPALWAALAVLLLTACGGRSGHTRSDGIHTPQHGHAADTRRALSGIRAAGSWAPGQHKVTVEELGAARGQLPAIDEKTGTNLSAQVASARAGSTIHLGSGTYPPIIDYTARSGWVTVSGQGDLRPPIIHGAELFGARFVRFVDVHFDEGLYITARSFRTQAARDIQVVNSQITCANTHSTQTGSKGIFIRGATTDVSVVGDLITGCVVGFSSAVQDEPSRDIVIEHDTVSHIYGDGIDLGGLSDVIIAHNLIKDIYDPAQQYHDDAIQFFGNTQNVSVFDNVLDNSRSQLILIQGADIPTADDRPSNSDISVEHNLLYGAGGVAIQDEGGLFVRVVGNTIWANHYGALWLRNSGRQRPVSTVIIGNVLSELAVFDSDQPSIDRDNFIGRAVDARLSRSDRVHFAPSFVDANLGDFALRGGTVPSDLEMASAGATDLFGRTIPARALPGAIQIGDPRQEFGRPRGLPRTQSNDATRRPLLMQTPLSR